MSQAIVTQYKNIRKKSKLVELLPWIGGGTSTTIYPNIYLSSPVYNSVYSDKPDPYMISTLIHEQEHIVRIRKMGPAKWYMKYFLSRKFRLDEELAATKPQLAYIKSLGLTFNLERKARALSGVLYLWAASYKDVLAKLIQIWDNV